MNELGIYIQRDAEGNAVSMDNFPLALADTVSFFLKELADLGNALPGASKPTLGLKNGSVAAILQYEDREISEQIDAVLIGESDQPALIRAFKRIQTGLQKHPSEAHVFWTLGNTKKDITENILIQKFRVKKKRKNIEKPELKFITGKLFSVGGKNQSNIHVENNEGNTVIECSQAQARTINSALYEIVYISALHFPNKPHPTFITQYPDESPFFRIKRIWERFKELGLEEKYAYLLEEMQSMISSFPQDKATFISFCETLDYSQADRGALRIVLSELKPIKSIDDRILELYESLAGHLRQGNPIGRI